MENGNPAQGVVRVSHERWLEAQRFESSDWVRKNRRNNLLTVLRKYLTAFITNRDLYALYRRFGDLYCGDDWNYWWLRAFDEYAALPKNLGRALEVGCGPYTNMRLISRICSIREIHLSDPLMEVYRTFRRTWLVEQIARGAAAVNDDSCESISYPDNHFDLLVCINVLDHVRDAVGCLEEITRVIRPGGILVLGQDLTDDEDIRRSRKVARDVGHPIRICHSALDDVLSPRFDPRLRKILPREEGRNRAAHYGVYVLIGEKAESQETQADAIELQGI